MNAALSARAPSLALRAASLFPVRACVLGYKLRVEGHVEVQQLSPTAIEARVKSDRARLVRLRSTADALAASCTCTPSELDAPTCQHVWATLLEVDHVGALEGVRTAIGKLSFLPLASPIEPKPIEGVPTKATKSKNVHPAPEPTSATAPPASACRPKKK